MAEENIRYTPLPVDVNGLRSPVTAVTAVPAVSALPQAAGMKIFSGTISTGGSHGYSAVIKLAVILLIGIWAAASYLIWLKPKVQAYEAVVHVSDSVGMLTSDMKRLADGTNRLKKQAMTVTEVSQEQEGTFLNDTFSKDTNVAGVTSKRDVISMLLREGEVAIAGRDAFGESKNVDVLGTTASDLEPPIVKVQREIASIAKQNIALIDAISDDVATLSESLSAGSADGSSPSESISKLNPLLTRTSAYLHKARKVHAFEKANSELTIKVLPEYVSFLVIVIELAQSSDPQVHSNQLVDIRQRVQAMRMALQAEPVDNIPEAARDVHADNIAFIVSFEKSVEAISASIAVQDFEAFARAVEMHTRDIQPLMNRSALQYVSYWENNDIIGEHQTLLDDYQSLSRSLAEQKAEGDELRLDVISGFVN